MCSLLFSGGKKFNVLSCQLLIFALVVWCVEVELICELPIILKENSQKKQNPVKVFCTTVKQQLTKSHIGKQVVIQLHIIDPSTDLSRIRNQQRDQGSDITFYLWLWMMPIIVNSLNLQHLRNGSVYCINFLFDTTAYQRQQVYVFANKYDPFEWKRMWNFTHLSIHWCSTLAAMIFVMWSFVFQLYQ